MKQQSLASLTYEGMKKRPKREKFLNEMEQVAPWERLLVLIEPHYPKADNGRQPRGLRVLRIDCLQQWYGLSDPGAEEAFFNSKKGFNRHPKVAGHFSTRWQIGQTDVSTSPFSAWAFKTGRMIATETRGNPSGSEATRPQQQAG